MHIIYYRYVAQCKFSTFLTSQKHISMPILYGHFSSPISKRTPSNSASLENAFRSKPLSKYLLSFYHASTSPSTKSTLPQEPHNFSQHSELLQHLY